MKTDIFRHTKLKILHTINPKLQEILKDVFQVEQNDTRWKFVPIQRNKSAGNDDYLGKYIFFYND